MWSFPLKTPAVALVTLVSLPSTSFPKTKHVWQTGEIVDYSEPAPFHGRMTNGQFSQTAPQSVPIGRLSTYTIQSNGYLFYCGEFELLESPPEIALHSTVRFYHVKDHIVLLEEAGREHKAHLSKQVRLKQ